MTWICPSVIETVWPSCALQIGLRPSHSMGEWVSFPSFPLIIHPTIYIRQHGTARFAHSHHTRTEKQTLSMHRGGRGVRDPSVRPSVCPCVHASSIVPCRAFCSPSVSYIRSALVRRWSKIDIFSVVWWMSVRISGGGFLPNVSARFQRSSRVRPMHGPYLESMSNCRSWYSSSLQSHPNGLVPSALGTGTGYTPGVLAAENMPGPGVPAAVPLVVGTGREGVAVDAEPTEVRGEGFLSVLRDMALLIVRRRMDGVRCTSIAI
mmetsp:Transcript_25505/g.63174  ORF Transcript_25505/g.63174 Transcript_25505/m.63174 type:complete len:263 (+) Transcript_25505:654-1442(+)